jgi:hypothetical protein
VITHPDGMAYQVDARRQSLRVDAERARSMQTERARFNRHWFMSMLTALVALVGVRSGGA